MSIPHIIFGLSVIFLLLMLIGVMLGPTMEEVEDPSEYSRIRSHGLILSGRWYRCETCAYRKIWRWIPYIIFGVIVVFLLLTLIGVMLGPTLEEIEDAREFRRLRAIAEAEREARLDAARERLYRKFIEEAEEAYEGGYCNSCQV